MPLPLLKPCPSGAAGQLLPPCQAQAKTQFIAPLPPCPAIRTALLGIQTQKNGAAHWERLRFLNNNAYERVGGVLSHTNALTWGFIVYSYVFGSFYAR